MMIRTLGFAALGLLALAAPANATCNATIATSASAQSIINGAAVGQTVCWANGSYQLASSLQMKSGVNLQATTVRGVVLNYTGNGGFSFVVPQAGHDVVITGFVLDGSGAGVSGGGGFDVEPGAAHITFTQGTVRHIHGGGNDQNGVQLNGVDHLRVTSNIFQDIVGTGVMSYRMTDGSIDSNRFDPPVFEPIHIYIDTFPANNVTASFNNIKGFGRHAIEVQSYPGLVNLTVAGNYVAGAYNDERWLDCSGGRGSAQNPCTGGHMGLSVSVNGASNVSIHRNSLTGSVGTGGVVLVGSTYVRDLGTTVNSAAIEIGDSTGVAVYDNYPISHWAQGVLDSDTRQWSFTGNSLCDVPTVIALNGGIMPNPGSPNTITSTCP